MVASNVTAAPTPLNDLPSKRRTQSKRRTRLQFDQHAASRQEIIATMRVLLQEGSYASISVSDLAARAKVSRVTFYRHFSSKAALVRELFSDVIASAQKSYLELASRPVPAQGEVVLLGEAMMADPELRQAMQELREKLFAGLGRVMPSYRAATMPSLAGRQVRLRAILLHEQYHAFQTMMAHDRSLRSTIAIPVMARLFCQFFADAAALIAIAPILRATCGTEPPAAGRPRVEFLP